LTAHQTLDNTSGESSIGKKGAHGTYQRKIVELLRGYYRFKKLRFYVFEELLSLKYSEGSLQKVLNSVLKKSKIKKLVTLHWLRHIMLHIFCKVALTLDISKNYWVITRAKRLRYITM
jgi:hypothetical protein